MKGPIEAGEVKPESADTPGDGPAAPPREFRTMAPHEWPSEALCWKGSKQKGELRRAWRLAVCTEYGEHNRVLRLAWTLCELSASTGYAFGSDGHLALETGLLRKNVQLGLTQLARSGAIVRVHVPNGASFQRRIFLGKDIVQRCVSTPHRGGYDHPPPQGGRDTPHRGDTEKRSTTAKTRRRKLTESERARLDAERKAARERGDATPHWLRDAD